MQRSSSLPASSHIIPSSLQPSSHSTHQSSRASAPLEFPTQGNTTPNISHDYQEERTPLEIPDGKSVISLHGNLLVIK